MGFSLIFSNAMYRVWISPNTVFDILTQLCLPTASSSVFLVITQSEFVVL